MRLYRTPRSCKSLKLRKRKSGSEETARSDDEFKGQFLDALRIDAQNENGA
jgi:hypothetical protein